MKKILMATALAFGSLGLVACETVTPVAEANTRSTLLDEKALYSAEATYNTLANSYLTLDEKNQLSPEQKAWAKSYLINAYDALLALRAAYRIGDADTFARKLVEFEQLKTALEGIL